MNSVGFMCRMYPQVKWKVQHPNHSLKPLYRGDSWWSSGYDSEPPLQGAWVPFLVRELIFLRLGAQPETKKDPPLCKQGHL